MAEPEEQRVAVARLGEQGVELPGWEGQAEALRGAEERAVERRDAVEGVEALGDGEALPVALSVEAAARPVALLVEAEGAEALGDGEALPVALLVEAAAQPVALRV